MSVKSTLKTISRPDKDIAVWAKDFNKIAFELGQTAFSQIQEPFLDELRFYPPELPNQKYIRTYRLRRGWKVLLKRLNGNTYTLTVTNDTDYTVFVVGSLAQAESAAASFQASIHRGRWSLATNTTQFWYDAFLEILNELFVKELSQFGTVVNKQRSFTRKTR